MYATVEDVTSRYGDVAYALAGKTDDGQIDVAAIERALAEASSEIDLTLRARYSVPLNPVPPVLRRVCVDIAVGALPRNGATEATVYERRARDARALLASLASGDITLGAEAAPAQSSGGGMAYAGPVSDFRQKLNDYV